MMNPDSGLIVHHSSFIVPKERHRRVPVIVDLSQAELHDFMAAMRPKGLFLWIAANDAEEQLAIIRRLERWR